MSILETLRLDEKTELCRVRLEDAEELFAVIDRNRDRLRQWLPWVTPEYDLEGARQFISTATGEMTDHKGLTLIIRHRGSICGAIGLHRILGRSKNTEIGYWIDAAHEGKGLMTAACRAVITEGFDAFGLHRIEIRCATWNHRSSAIPRRLGFVEEGILREAEWLHDRWVDLRVFSMLAQDWAK